METKKEKFKRLAEKRTNTVLTKLDLLGNCSNRWVYSWDDKEIDEIFSIIKKKVKEIQSRYKNKKHLNFTLRN